MPGTFTQIYIQVVFAVKHRESLILSVWEDELYKYITGITQNKEQKMLAINGMPDHIHFLFGMKPTCCISDMVKETKNHLPILLMIKILHSRSFIGRKDLVHSSIVTQH